ncbi:hypothetical protein D3C78_1890770 [compost metagenome]
MLVQLNAGGWIRDMEEGMETVRASFPLQAYEPESREDWAAAYAKYCSLNALTLP